MLQAPDAQAVETMARTPIHPGEILADELEALGMSALALAKALAKRTTKEPKVHSHVGSAAFRRLPADQC